MHAADLPLHPTMRHPLTGAPLRAIWVRPDGRAMWPIIGAAEDPDPKADPADPDPKGDPKDDPKPGPKADPDKPLGENGEKALKAERDARKALEVQLADLKKGLAAALGGKDDGDKPDASDTIAQVQQQIADLQHEKRVLALANDYRITDKDDLALLSTIKDDEGLKKLAERLAPAEEERDAKSRRPKPDRSQGGGGSDGTSGGKSVAQVMEERRAAREAKSKSNT